jgi:hypothetical protein
MSMVLLTTFLFAVLPDVNSVYKAIFAMLIGVGAMILYIIAIEKERKLKERIETLESKMKNEEEIK